MDSMSGFMASRAACQQLAKNSSHFMNGDERRTLQVAIITLAAMVAEIAFGFVTGSMALLADGWHMGTHAFALGLSYAAFILARRHAASSRFTFGSGKFGVLSGYTSSLLLGAAGVWMMAESAIRFFNPHEIAYGEAIAVAVLGLLVNLVSILILGSGGHGHAHEHGHVHEHAHHASSHDHNYRAAYLHVLADALTSVMAIAALVCGFFFGWRFLDPLAGAVGGFMICRWAWGLLRDSAAILLDAEAEQLRDRIAELVESDKQSRIVDLHVWRIGSNSASAILSISGHASLGVADYERRLSGLEGLAHVNIELR